MASSIIMGLSLLMVFYGRNAAGDPSVSSSSRYGCSYCCSRIDNQTTILKSISYATEKLTKDVRDTKEGVEDDIPSELKKLTVNQEKQSSELKGVKASVGDIAISLNKHSEDLLVHDTRLKEQGLLLAELNTLVKSKLERQSVDLDALKTSVGTDIPSKLETQSSELKGIKASVSEAAISLKKHSEDLLVHDARLKEQGLLLEKLNRLVLGLHDSLGVFLGVGPKDCSDIGALGRSASGVYRVYPGSSAKRIQTDVYCDMTTPGGNWLVFQRRKDGSVNFERTWIEYLNGFGNPSGEFWLGNEALYLLTSNRKYKLHIDMEDFDGQKRYAEYATFSIGSSIDRYRLTIAGYTGDAGDNFSGTHNGMKFSTKDADNDNFQDGSCSQIHRGGWWYNYCHGSNLNGLYLGGPHTSYADGIDWYTFRGHYYSLKTTEMKIAVAN